MGISGFREKYAVLLGDTLDDSQKKYIMTRYVSIVEELEWKHRLVTTTYFILSNLITMAGVLVTAFISFDKFASFSNSTVGALLWVAWALGLVLTLSNKFLDVFDIPKRYHLGLVTLEKLRSEGYSFASTSGQYAADPVRYTTFCTRVEKIYLKSIGSSPSVGADNSLQEILASGQDKITVDLK